MTNQNSKIMLAALVVAFGLAPVAYYLLAIPFVNAELASQSQTYLNHLRKGTSSFTWSFDRPDDLIPASLNQFEALEVETGQLSLTSPGVNAFLSLNFRGKVAHAGTFSKLELDIRSDRATRLLLFHRTTPSSAVHATHPIAVAQGEQTLMLDVGRLDWEALSFEDGNKRPIDRAPSRWGGNEGTIWSLRIHPATTPGTQIAIAEIRLLPASPRPDAQMSTLLWPCNEPPIAADALQCVPPQPALLGTAKWFEKQQDLRSVNPASWVFRTAQASPVMPFVLNKGTRVWATASLVCAMALLLTSLFPPSSRKPLAELLLWLGTAVAALFDPSWILTAIALVGALALLWRSDWRPFGATHSAQAWRATAAFVIVAIGVLAITAGLTAFGGRDIADRIAVYPLWAPVQQLVLGPVIVARLTQLRLHPAWIVSLGGFIFGLLHFPNFELMCLTGAAGCFWSWSFWRYGQLAPAVASHIIVALVAFYLLPTGVLWSGSVGTRFFS